MRKVCPRSHLFRNACQRTSTSSPLRPGADDHSRIGSGSLPPGRTSTCRSSAAGRPAVEKTRAPGPVCISPRCHRPTSDVRTLVSSSGGNQRCVDLTDGTQNLVPVLRSLDPCRKTGHQGHVRSGAVPGRPFPQGRLDETADQVEMVEVVRPQPPRPGLNLEPQRQTEVWIRRGLSCATRERDTAAAPHP